MAQDVVLTAEPRQERGRSEVRKMRASGRLPGVIYGSGIDSRALAVDRAEFIRTLHAHGAHPLVTLKLGGEDFLALVKEVQVDPVRLEALHVDFLRVREDVAVQTQVALELEGSPAGVKEGGILETQLTTLNIEALPRSIPEVITLDVSGLDMNQTVRVSDIVAPDGVRILNDPDETVASVVAPRVEEEPSAEEELEPGEVPEIGEEPEGEEGASDDGGEGGGEE